MSRPQTPQAEEPEDSAGCWWASGPAGAVGQGDRDDVELLLGPQLGVGAVGDLRDLAADALVREPARGELEVVARRAHGEPHPVGGCARPGEPDLERLLGDQPVLVGALVAGHELGDPGPHGRAWSARQLRHGGTPLRMVIRRAVSSAMSSHPLAHRRRQRVGVGEEGLGQRRACARRRATSGKNASAASASTQPLRTSAVAGSSAK